MKIAMLSTIAWRTPPRAYGPREQIVYNLTEGLIKRGIDVTLFATADSVTKAALTAVVPRGYEEDKTLEAKVWECLHIAGVFERAGEFDLIHNHFDFLPLTYSRLVKTPVVTTLHGFSSLQNVEVYKAYQDIGHYISISNADRHPDLQYLDTIYHGLDLSRFRFSAKTKGYLLFFGRIHPDKGTHTAIEIAREAGKKLIIAGIIQDNDYFKTQVEPFLDNDRFKFLGAAGPELRQQLLGGALALLHPISFKEPFGLSVIEAMACGTPVIAFNLGSMPEIIADGESGFLVQNVAEAVRKVEEAKKLDRRKIRQWVESRFSLERMVGDYVKAYQKILKLPT